MFFFMNRTKAIGIFDSGIGGLTVANEISKLLPNEDIIYFGDSKHLPYGDKSEEAILRFSKNITEFLLEQECKVIVIACNTASAIAFDAVKKICHNKAIAINVIDPVVKSTLGSPAKVVGIIGTKNTINSEVYSTKLRAQNPSLDTASLATPLLVPMIEEGFYQNKISETIIGNYLSNEKLKYIDHLILGCTHYPLIEKDIKNYYNHKVTVINSAKIVSKQVQKVLLEKGLSNKPDHLSQKKFFVSDYTKSFERSAQHFFGDIINLEERETLNKH